MAAHTGSLANVPQGTAQPKVSHHLVSEAHTSSDTLALSRPESFDVDDIPVEVLAWRPSTGAYIRNMAMTSFIQTTGVLTITPSTSLAAGDRLVVQYANLGVL